jgi:hypothetical protein
VVATRLRLALDQNFPVLILNATDLIPEVEITSVHRIDPRLSDLDDRKLVIALHQLGWRGLITNNYKMLWIPSEIAAVVKTKAVIFAVEGLGDDPLRATGAVLLELPDVVKRVRPGKAQVFRVHPRAPQPVDAWNYFRQAADRRRVDTSLLYEDVRVTDEELNTRVLSP